MKLTAKVDIRRLKLKMIRWMKSCREEEKASLKEFSRDFVAAAMKFTPPGNGRVSLGKAHKMLKERIEEDFLGHGDTAELDASHFGWYRDPWGRRYARVTGAGISRDKQGRVSPFYAFKGRPSQKLLQGMGVGRYRVEYLPSLQGVVQNGRSQGEAYYFYRAAHHGRRNAKPVRLGWRGVRHVTSRAALLAEVRRRKFLVGHLAAGWKPIALRSGAKLPAAVKKHSGHGSVTMRHDSRHGAVATAVNHSADRRLQSIVDRNIPMLSKKFRATARKRAKQQFAPALRKA